MLTQIDVFLFFLWSVLLRLTPWWKVNTIKYFVHVSYSSSTSLRNINGTWFFLLNFYFHCYWKGLFKFSYRYNKWQNHCSDSSVFQGSQTFLVKARYFKLCRSYDLCHNNSLMPLQQKISQRLYIKCWLKEKLATSR